MRRTLKYSGFTWRSILQGVLLISVLISGVSLFAQQSTNRILTIDPEDQEYTDGIYSIVDFVDVFIDSTGEWTIDELSSDSMQNRFAPDSLEFTNRFLSDFGPDIKYLWARLDIATTSDHYEEWLLNFTSHEVEGYVENGSGTWQHHRSGVFIRVDDRQFKGVYIPITPVGVNIQPGDTIRALLRLKAPNCGLQNTISSQFNATLFRRDTFLNINKSYQGWIFFITGVVLAIAIYNLIIFIYQRNRVSLYFALFMLFYLLVYLSFKASHDIILPGRDWDHGMSFLKAYQALLGVFLYLFSREFLRLKQLLPKWNKVWFWLVILVVLHSIIMITNWTIAGDWSDAEPAIFWPLVLVRSFLSTAELILVILLGVLSWVKGNRVAWIYLLAMFPYVVQEIANSLSYAIALPNNQWLNGDVGTVFMVMLFSLGLARQIKELQDQKVAADKAGALDRAAAQRLKELDEFKTRFFTNITHQFRTPLTVILGMAEQIKAQPSTWVNKGADLITRNGYRLLELVNQILSLAKLDAGRLELNMIQGNINKYIAYIVESFHSLARKNKVNLQFSNEQDEIIMDYDPEKVIDIMSNLISNAIKFTGERGKVIVRTSLSDDNLLKVTVRDSGSGIPPELHAQIFDRFYQVEPGMEDKQGSGIGLAIVKELSELMKGRIEVESELGVGSTFTLYLPITRVARRVDDKDIIAETKGKKAVTPTVGPVESIQIGKGDKPVVLVIDDNKDVVTYISSVLADRFGIVSAYDGRQGYARARKTIPDLIVSDIMMPAVDGIELCQELKSDKLTSHIPILLLTAKTDTPSRIEGWHAGADAYLTKPFNSEELIVRIDELIAIRSRLQERYQDIGHLFTAENEDGRSYSDPENDFMRELHSVIRERISDPDFTIAELCMEVGMSRTQLYKKFKALTNQSLASFIRKVRLHKAHELLEAGGLNVTQVALETGFANLSSFSRAFREEYGVSPSDVLRPVH